MRFRKELPQTLERLAQGFLKLLQFDYSDEYAARFLSLRHLLMASSLSEILPALVASERELTSSSFRRRKPLAEGELMPLYNRLNEAISPLRQYSEETLLSLRAVPLSETISDLEETARFISFEGTEPYRTILLQVLSNWRELLRLEIRRLDGEAKLEFFVPREITPGETLTIILGILNHGPAPARNLKVRLMSQGLVNVQPDIHTYHAIVSSE